MADTKTSPPAYDLSTAELVQRGTEQVSKLVREELALTRAEMVGKGKRAGVGAGLFGGGGAMALYGGGALVAAAIIGLAAVMPDGIAALVVGVVLLAIAGLLALSGKRRVSQAMPVAPKSTAGNLRADAETMRSAARDRGRK
ncbi:phage holin family protein [Micromonospora sp. NPDC004704]